MHATGARAFRDRWNRACAWKQPVCSVVRGGAVVRAGRRALGLKGWDMASGAGTAEEGGGEKWLVAVGVGLAVGLPVLVPVVEKVVDVGMTEEDEEAVDVGDEDEEGEAERERRAAARGTGLRRGGGGKAEVLVAMR